MDVQVTAKQAAFLAATADEVLYGGAAGGGKSHVQLLDAFLYAMKYPGSNQIILRTSFPELERSLINKAQKMYPRDLYSYNISKHVMTFSNGSVLEFGYSANDNDALNYLSSEFDQIRFDEATMFTPEQLTMIGSRVRGINQFPKQVKYSTNPPGPGHDFLKARFVDVAPPMTEFEIDGTYSKVLGRALKGIYIPAKLTDNRFLMEHDPDYMLRLERFPEAMRKAYLEGSWDLFEGLYFPEFSRDVHVVKPFQIPEHWKLYYVMDYGLDMLAGYWIALDEHDRGYVVKELYKPNMIISDAAQAVLAGTPKGFKVAQYIAPPDLWNRRQETGKSVADIFRENGIFLTRTSNDRIDGWMATKEWLKPFTDETGEQVIAKLRVFDTCVHLIRSLSNIQADPNNPNDTADKPHDVTHACDAIRYFCVYRTQGPRKTPERTEHQKRQDQELEVLTGAKLYDVYGGGGNGWWNPY